MKPYNYCLRSEVWDENLSINYIGLDDMRVTEEFIRVDFTEGYLIFGAVGMNQRINIPLTSILTKYIPDLEVLYTKTLHSYQPLLFNARFYDI